MKRFVLRRLCSAILLLFVSTIVIFYGLRAAPGDVTSQLVNPANSYSTYLIPNLKHHLGLDRPLVNQYLIFMRNLFEGDPGISLINGSPITTIIGRAGVQTLKLGAAAFVLTYLVAIPLGLLAAWRRNSVLDQGTMLVAVLGMGVPNFFLAILLIHFFSIDLRWLPAAGSGGISYLVLPALVLAAQAIAVNLRMVRSSVLEQLSRDYVRTLRAKGISERRIVAVHALRNALPPILALAGITMRDLLAYTMIVEVIFRWPGLGYQLVESILQRDYTLSQVLAILLAVCVIFFNFLADLGQRYADPRVREEAYG
ncbi:MAG TPA: ABC transporter permease [Gaiellaceae bacterium]|nr:ABC transporter permease [Gaiellaceae bacterium]